jgi:putative DNA primase/helicase
MRRASLNNKAIKTRASGHWRSIFLLYAPSLADALSQLGQHVQCPKHGGTNGFRFFNDALQTGGGVCNTCGVFSDGVSLLMWTNEWDYQTAIRAIQKFIDSKSIPLIAISRQSNEVRESSSVDSARVKNMWRESVADDGTIQQYFHGRGLLEDVPPSLRLIKSLGYFVNGTLLGNYPAMAAQITRQDKFIGLHLTYLKNDGSGKAPVPSPKKIKKFVSKVIGGAVQLYPSQPNTPLVLCEGIETGLAVHSITGWAVWACLTAILLEKVVVPTEVTKIYIAADRDRSKTGERSAGKLAKQLIEEGHEVFIVQPPAPIPEEAKGLDWADQLLKENYDVRR